MLRIMRPVYVWQNWNEPPDSAMYIFPRYEDGSGIPADFPLEPADVLLPFDGYTIDFAVTANDVRLKYMPAYILLDAINNVDLSTARVLDIHNIEAIHRTISFASTEKKLEMLRLSGNFDEIDFAFHNAAEIGIHAQESKKRLAELERLQGPYSEAAQTARQYADRLEKSANITAKLLEVYMHRTVSHS